MVTVLSQENGSSYVGGDMRKNNPQHRISGRMNAASIDRSPRLQRVANLLYSGVCYSTLDIIRLANVCAVSSCISELRANGFDIGCARFKDVWFYWMIDTEV
jgi:hypothetical protein